MEKEAAGEVHYGTGKRSVHRYVCVPVPSNEALVAQRFSERLAKRDSHVFDRVMRVDVEVALAVHAQPEAAVFGEQVEHVIQKTYAGLVAVGVGPIELKLDAHAGLGSFTRHRGGSCAEIAVFSRFGHVWGCCKRTNIRFRPSYCITYVKICSFSGAPTSSDGDRRLFG